MNKIIQFRSPNQNSLIAYIDHETEEGLEQRIRFVAEEQGIALLEAASLDMVLSYLASDPTPVVVQFSGFGPEVRPFFDSVSQISPDTPVIVMLDRASVQDAVRFVRNGAFDCFGPGASLGELTGALQAALDHCAKRKAARKVLECEPWRKSLVGKSPAMEKVAKTISLIAPRNSTVLITGESGTGKEMAAKAIHQASSRAKRPMISVNCSALPEHLIEAELFGHVKGAFTGAANNRVGRFEQADGGTIFLDEIGDFPFHLQAKLLRVLQEREIQRLGGTETVKIDVRVIAATNADLLKKVEEGTFREDLYYRLNVIPLHMPSLRERVSDVPSLVNHFVKKVCTAEGLTPMEVSAGAMQSLCDYSWPGNVRQLENVVEQAVVMNADSECLSASDFCLPSGVRTERSAPVSTPASPISAPKSNLPEEGVDFTALLRQFERGILDQALMKAQGNKTLAAEMLGLPRTTLVNKLRALESAA